ncbi:MAG: amidohydrolase [Candidatus Aminicenantes bacterium]|nr:amidohydrolase [Candidatus Aminicenantes bacterium]
MSIRALSLGFLAFLNTAAAVPPALSPQSASVSLPPKTLESLRTRLDRAAETVFPKVVAWRRDIHQHPELGNREFRTSGIVAEHLQSLGLDVRTKVAHTGVVGILRGGRPGPTVALRADMDALPITEETDVPFRSTVKTEYNGRETGVMHACGHDMHTAILMGAAEALAAVKDDLPGTVVFIFQPAEEGSPAGEEGGARLMVEDGVLDRPNVEAVFGLHQAAFEVGAIGLRAGGAMASSDSLSILVRGRQTHAAMPWMGVDPIVVAAQIILGLQTIVSRQMDLTTAPAVISIGQIEGGNRGNVIPDSARLVGTIRTLDPAMRLEIRTRIKRIAESIAAASGATAEVSIGSGAPVTYNDPALTARMTGTLRRLVGEMLVTDLPPLTASEDFAFFQEKVPGLYFFLGAAPRGSDPAGVEPSHSPRFNPDEGALPVGVRAMAHLALDFLAGVR